MSTAYTFTVIAALLAVSAFFSACETAMASASRLRLKIAAERGVNCANTALSLLDDYTRALSTDLFGNNLVNIALSSIAASWALRHFGVEYELLTAIITAAAVLFFGEILPKVLAAEFADKTVLFIARPFAVVNAVFWPFVSAVTALTNKISPWWTPEEPEPSATVEELSELLDTIEDEGVFTEAESELIKSAIEFTDSDARDIMTPRVDMEAFDIEDGLEALLSDDSLMSYSRVPVYRDSIDNIIGILPTMSLMRAVIEHGRENTDVAALVNPVVYAHMTRPISSILTELRKKRLQAAVVVDEFGGTMGMLTLEDIIEEIVGDIFDETDDVTNEITPLSDREYDVDGGAGIFDLFDEIDYEPRDFESDYTTVGGWATEVLDRFPQAGDHFVFGRLEVDVLSAKAMRVEKLRVHLLPEEPEDGD